MGILGYMFYPWSLILQGIALIHFIRRRPDMYWIYVILFLGWLGALVYLVMVALPEISGGSGGSDLFRSIPRRKRIRQLEALVLDNPSASNFEELGQLYLDDGKPELARAAFDRAIAAPFSTLDSFYRRGLCAIRLGDFPAAAADLERVIAKEPGYDFHRAAGLLAHAYAQTGQKEKAEAIFRDVTVTSTLSETYLNFADLLASQGRNAEARAWARKVLDKEPTMPGYLRRRERPWFRRARKTLRQLPA